MLSSRSTAASGHQHFRPGTRLSYVMSAIDEGLIAAACAGDATATATLLERLWPDAYRIAWSIAGERTAAEDAAQEACARVLRGLPGLREAASFRPWFYRIVVNEAKTKVRRTVR